MDATTRGIRAALLGLGVNAVPALTKLVAGVAGNSYALVADAVESSTDIFSSLVVWRGLRVAAKPPDPDYPYGHGKAEPIAAAVVSLMLLAAAVGIAVAAVEEIRTPHPARPRSRWRFSSASFWSRRCCSAGWRRSGRRPAARR